MRDILKRKSVIMLICIFFAGFLGPMLISGHPSDVTGAPFARPLWWNAKLPLSSEYVVGNSGVEINWEKLPPEIFALNGRITADPEKDVRIIWSTPVGEKTLDTLTGSDLYWINMDGRDMIFKQKLGLPLIGKSAEHLFPMSGRYSLRTEGAMETELSLSLSGGWEGLLGTDQRGRDVLTLLIFGIRTSLIVGISATLIASLLGLGLGLATGYIGGLFDAFVMRIVDVLLSIPTLPIMMVLAGLWGKRPLAACTHTIDIFLDGNGAFSQGACTDCKGKSMGGGAQGPGCKSADTSSGATSCRRRHRYFLQILRWVPGCDTGRSRACLFLDCPIRGSYHGAGCSMRPTPSVLSLKAHGGCLYLPVSVLWPCA